MNRQVSNRAVAPWLAGVGCVVAALSLGTHAAADSGADHQALDERPIQLGVSGGSIEPVIDHALAYCYAGTLGSLVRDANNNQYILSNNHVLAKENNPDNSLSPNGYNIVQPGILDDVCTINGGDPNNIVGSLSSYVPIVFGKGKNLPSNDVDAAIAATNFGSFSGRVDPSGSIMDIGVLTQESPIVATPNVTRVQKSGRTTGQTFGVVTAVSAAIKVSYSSGTAYFVNQIAITGLCGTTFSDAGDSGSTIFNLPENAPRAAVGLLFAGGGSTTFANPMANVLSELGGTLAPNGGQATNPVAGLTMVAGGSDLVDDTVNPAIPTCSGGGGGGHGGGRPHVAAHPNALARAAQIAEAHRDALLAIQGVIGYGIGADDAGNPVIRLYLEDARTPAGQPLPSHLEGIAVERIVTGKIKAY